MPLLRSFISFDFAGPNVLVPSASAADVTRVVLQPVAEPVCSKCGESAKGTHRLQATFNGRAVLDESVSVTDDEAVVVRELTALLESFRAVVAARAR